jgi:putative endonuclease
VARAGGSGERGPAERRARGRAAEELAAAFLEERGLEILDRNHAVRQGEVDLVAREGEVLCFVEVRSRTSDAQGGPEETVGATKARRVVAAATDWAARHGGLDREIRFDVVAVTLLDGAPPRLEHFRGAFDADGLPGLW